MRNLLSLCASFGVASVLALSAASVSAQSIDLGRGELPLTVPSNYDESKPASLVVLLHGYTSSGAGQEAYFQLGKLADEFNFILVAPDGEAEPEGRKSRFWNASEACCNFNSSEVNDSAYVLDIINEVKSEYKIDENRVYLVGHSNGGFMSYRAAYDHSDVIAAIASVAGASHSGEREAPANPVHVLQIHGTKDDTIAYEGADIRGNKYPSAKQTVETWAAYDGCSLETENGEALDLEAQLAGKESTVVKYNKGCKDGGSAELWTIADGSHVPSVSESFGRHVIEWLMDHPKTN